MQPEIFNDVFGPVMQAGSSSHLAGPCRITKLAFDALGTQPKYIRIRFPAGGSFAGSFGLMHEDLGMLAGAMGYDPRDAAMWGVKTELADKGIDFSFHHEEVPESQHPNVLGVELRSSEGDSVDVVGASIGGGRVEIYRIQNHTTKFSGDSALLLWESQVPSALERYLAGHALELRHDAGLAAYLEESWLTPVLDFVRSGGFPVPRVLHQALPVGRSKDAAPPPFDSFATWRAHATTRGQTLSESALDYEVAASGWERARIIVEMTSIEALLRVETRALLDAQIGLDEDAFRRLDYQILPPSRPRVLGGGPLYEALRMAAAVNAKPRGMVIVPGPMGTGGGYMFAALSAVGEATGSSHEAVLRGLFVAGIIGVIGYTRAEPTGEVMGCAGECGLCSAMAAGAIVAMLDGDADAVEHAASFALQAAAGMPCDPIPGGFEQPCFSRIVQAVGNALSFAELALSGSSAVLPFDEALDYVFRMGKSLPEDLRCTCAGGACLTPTAIRLTKTFNASRNSKPIEKL